MPNPVVQATQLVALTTGLKTTLAYMPSPICIHGDPESAHLDTQWILDSRLAL